jgi:glucose/arabinose dehydrogenase
VTTIGSATNATPEGDDRSVERAAIHEYSPDGRSHRLFASGLRNRSALHLPGTDTPGRRSTNVTTSAMISSPTTSRPSATADSTAGPIRICRSASRSTVSAQRPDLVATARAPDVLLPSHSAALGLIFYTGSQFPPAYRNSALVALHGSINRSKLSGYRVVRVPFRDGVASGAPEDFLSGFIASDGDDKEVWGRPVGVLQLPDGSVLVSDDGGNRVWRVSYLTK